MNYRNKTHLIESVQLRKVAEFLEAQNIPITFFGKAWSKATGNWIYFNTVLDLDHLRSHFNLDETIVVHENLDPKSGTERGFIDQTTGEGVMGRLKMN